MGADNWSVCPRCLAEAVTGRTRSEEAVAALYGQVTAAEYEEARRALPPEPDPERFRTFREDFEVTGAASGRINFDYRGRCQSCGLGVTMEVAKDFFP